ncbi:hypothetical protein Fleli_2739 [Bernardetia litoralis DSM 6794]|uniref:Bacterial Pleckstrin homology domain-containing protein n=1 Tax=Bernardetia litoralis (strain ATCC 23117 / DSM 6794 / NBRC 15988 / NCIMB 1366 / Fx l1 / Sio-4) TaxID=880071 RepID=I4AMA8_BERLS|nr:hypothetical protein [Bernardetia litoralis]AFM05093.1 hypothetical protein Fleli_2739 [Bernardetia litoralis DSM 6794]
MKNHKEKFEEPIFEEKQQLYKNKVMAFICFVVSLVTLVSLMQEKLNSINLITAFSTAGVLILITALLNLKTKVFAESIKITMFPFLINKTIKKEDILKVEDVKYNPILNWGGWGIKINFKGIAYNMYGNRGVKLTMKNGRIILLGSQKSYLLYDAILRNNY